MGTIAVFLFALMLMFAAGENRYVFAARTPPAKTSVKAAAKPTAKITAQRKRAPKAVGTLYRGTVKEVYPEDLMFALRIGSGKLPYAVQVLATTQIVSASGDPLAFEQLFAGQRVSVRGKLRSRTVIQANRITVGG